VSFYVFNISLDEREQRKRKKSLNVKFPMESCFHSCHSHKTRNLFLRVIIVLEHTQHAVLRLKPQLCLYPCRKRCQEKIRVFLFVHATSTGLNIPSHRTEWNNVLSKVKIITCTHWKDHISYCKLRLP